MTSLTQQKQDLRDILHDMLMRSYDKKSERGKRLMTLLMIRQLTAAMTISELRRWHHHLVILKEEIGRSK